MIFPQFFGSKALKVGRFSRERFASEDQRLWTEGRKIIAFCFFLFHRLKSTDRAGAIPVFKTCVTERNCTKSETYANRTYYTASQLTNENCSMLKRKQISLLFQW